MSRIPCTGEIIQLCTSDWGTEFFRVTGVIHYTFPSSCSSWGCITVEPCNLFSPLSDEDEYLEVVDEDEDFEVVDEFDLEDGSLPSPS